MLMRLAMAMAMALVLAVMGVDLVHGEPVIHQVPPPSPPLPPVVVWYAPFLSGGGYCSEAHSYVEAIHTAMPTATGAHDDEDDGDEHMDAGRHSAMASSGDGRAVPSPMPPSPRPFALHVTQHGDSINAMFVRDLPEPTRELLEELWIEERDFHWRLRQRPIAVAICHSEPGAWHPARYSTSRCPPAQAAFTVGRTMFETDRVPAGWTERMNAMDEIWVPTRFQEKVFVDGGVEPGKLIVLPEAVDVHFFDPAKVESPYDLTTEVTAHAVTSRATVFLSVFKWEERKAWRVLLRAYFGAFRRDEDDVVLVILTSAYHLASETAGDFLTLIGEFAKKELGKALDELPAVHVLPPNVPQEALPSLYKAATAFVLPSRGEGWGRPHVEAMAMALPVISTFWSGTTEYMTVENSYPLRIEGLVEITEGAFRGHKWAEPSVAHLTELLQRVKIHPEEARRKGLQAREDMIAKYSPEVIGKVLMKHLERVLAIVAERERLKSPPSSASVPSHEEL